MYVDIELKTLTFPYPGIEKKCIELVKKTGFEDRVIFCSFNHLSLQKVRLFAPEMKIGYLYLYASPTIVPFAKKLGVDALHITQHNLMSPGLLEKCREHEMIINAWTVNKPGDLQICAEHGVNAVITDYPDRMKQFRETLNLK